MTLMKGLPSDVGQGICWCRTIIHRQAINSKKRYSRWSRDYLVLNARFSEDAPELCETMPSHTAQAEFSQIETKMWINSLVQTQSEVIKHRFIYDCSQKETSRILHTSQQQISRLERKALAELKECVENGKRPREIVEIHSGGR